MPITYRDRGNCAGSGVCFIPLKSLLLPIIIFELYLNFGLLLFFFGPLDYQVRNPFLLPLYLIAAHLCLYFGYRKAIRKQPKAYSGLMPVSFLIRLAIVSVFVVALFNYINIVGSISGIPNAVLSGMKDLNRAYHDKFVINKLTGVLRYTFLCIMVSPLMMPLVVAYWTRLPTITRIIAVLVIIWDLGTWVAIGTTKGIADTFVLLPILVLFGYPHLIVKKISIKTKTLITAVAIAGIIIVIMFFSAAKGTSRFEASQVAYDCILRYDLFDNLPSGIGAGSAMITSYMVQGYHGLDLCLTKPFVWALGGGHSPFFLGELLRDDQGNTAASLSYPARVEFTEQWGMMVNWHSVYPWIASDITFPGTLLFVYFVGYLYGLSWIDWLVKGNPLAFAVFYQLTVTLLYFPCNNSQILGNIGVIGFIAWVVMWILTRTNRSVFISIT